jgi:hypothetical protein
MPPKRAGKRKHEKAPAYTAAELAAGKEGEVDIVTEEDTAGLASMLASGFAGVRPASTTQLSTPISPHGKNWHVFSTCVT